MSVGTIWFSGYRSLQRVHLQLGRLNVVTGANGVGKSNLYRALCLLSRSVRGGLGRAIAEEGGMPSVLWAGPRMAGKPVRMKLGFTAADFGFNRPDGPADDADPGFSFELVLGLPRPPAGRFKLDPKVKEEFVWFGSTRKPSTTFLNRTEDIVEIGPGPREPDSLIQNLDDSESALSQVQQPELYPELMSIRREIGGWRFYHQFDTSPGSRLRIDQVSTFSPVLDDDGCNLAAALQTVWEIGDRERLDQTIAEAFPGCRLEIIERQSARLGIALTMPGLERRLEGQELSDGTFRFLCLTAALLTPRPPELLAINEPETSLHPDLLPALARLIVAASQYSQVWVTTHSEPLAELIGEQTNFKHIQLELRDGATVVNCLENNK